MAASSNEGRSGLFQSDQSVVEAIRSLNGLFLQYRQCVKDHETEKQQIRGLFDVWVEEAMQIAEKQGKNPDEEQGILMVSEGKDGVEGVDGRDVESDIVLQHKQALLEEWELAEEVWQSQADMCAGKCTICRIRSGRHVAHDWRDCEGFSNDREAVEEAHKQVERGMLSGHSVEKLLGRCGECQAPRTECWLQIREGVEQPVCKYRGVVTEAVAGILAIGPDMVGEWEGREGRRRGAGVSDIEGFTGQRFGGVAVCRVWRAFGWVGVWDIREHKVDEVRERYLGRMQGMGAEVRGQMKGDRRTRGRYGVQRGQIGRGAEEEHGAWSTWSKWPR